MRCARKVAESGFYHVVTKGEADQTLFCDNADRAFYTRELGSTRDEHGLVLHAYCLMSNHVHLLIQDPKMCLSAAMKHLNEQYAEHFKRRTQRTGHVFKNRFWSEPVEDDSYLLCAMRYIHANPAIAGICQASAYPWSSVQDYLGREGITNTSMLLEMLGGQEGFIAFSRKEPYPSIPFPGSAFQKHLSDEELDRVIRSLIGDPQELKTQKHADRVRGVSLLVSHGLTASQIARTTNIPRSTIVRDLKRKSGQKGTVPF